MENLKIYNSVHIRCPLVDVDSLPVVCFEPLKNSFLSSLEHGKWKICCGALYVLILLSQGNIMIVQVRSFYCEGT